MLLALPLLMSISRCDEKIIMTMMITMKMTMMLLMSTSKCDEKIILAVAIMMTILMTMAMTMTKMMTMMITMAMTMMMTMMMTKTMTMMVKEMLQANFAEESKAQADAMVENLRSAFKELVPFHHHDDHDGNYDIW